ncbi:MAG: hypothetical protein PG981_001060 [Wolbachia endosymbiont of Ctenocephalides orientis wCori]|nr:MAG: hypothetical protein PG981_001060 [Wolbachia endosymbiont of Ctenocephalides orientis wCori]
MERINLKTETQIDMITRKLHLLYLIIHNTYLLYCQLFKIISYILYSSAKFIIDVSPRYCPGIKPFVLYPTSNNTLSLSDVL